MEFLNFKNKIQEQFEKMIEGKAELFEVNLDKDMLWNLYLDSFPDGTNEIFRERREHDCSCCRQFIKNIGNVVTIKNNEIISIWDIDIDCDIYKPVANALSNFVKLHMIDNIYISNFKKIGTDKNFEKTTEMIYEWNHLYLELPSKFVNHSNRTLGDIKGSKKSIRDVFKRSLDELSQESVEVVLDLINQNSLYKGEEWKKALTDFLNFKKQYLKLTTDIDRHNFAWEQVSKAGVVVGKIRNHSIGTLLIDITEGMDLDLAVRRYEKVVAPTNYKRPKAIYTQKMLDNAKKTIIELGFMDSLPRRHATIDDITVNNILFVNKDSAKQMGAMDIFEEMSKDIGVNVKTYSKVEEIGINDFINNVLPTAKELEVLVENKHSNNFVSLIAPVNKEAKSMLKWDNNFGWAYTGNITDSNIKNNVKNAGGKVDGVLRFSIQWNDTEYDDVDLDAHCIEPGGNKIYYANKRNSRTTGVLDVDIIKTKEGIPAVENITWKDINKMEEGTYKFIVNTFSGFCEHGFKAEIEFNGEVYNFEYSKRTRSGQKIEIAEVTYTKEEGFKMKTLLPSNMSNKEMWNISTNQFVPVTTIMYSPNYWDEQKRIGHRHYFFILKDCLNPERVNGFFNEYLSNDLNEHKRVFEALGSKMYVEPCDKQLSGLGFSATKRNEIIIKVKGNYERVLKVKF